jgi:hypothetical protein
VKPYPATPAQVERFRSERDAFHLVYRCPDCIHVAGESQACTLGYPNRELREADGYLDEAGQFVFCKYFEAS